MSTRSCKSSFLERHLIGAAIALLGVAAIVGSGGGGSAPECSFFSSVCNPTIDGPSAVPVASLPSRVIAQVGTTVVFAVRTSNLTQVSYRWCRADKGASACTTIAGATGATYMVAGVNLADDRARFNVTATGAEGVAYATSELLVSSVPPLVSQDGDFAEADWDVTTLIDPLQRGVTSTASRVASGGNPGAHRSVTASLPLAPASVWVFHMSRQSRYDPATQGAIYGVEFTEDCIRGSESYLPGTVPLIEQGGRRFVTAFGFARGCAVGAWGSVDALPVLLAEDFTLAVGPACVAGTPCLDFSASAPPLQFGFATVAALEGGLPPGSVADFSIGVDNWKVSVWRR